MSASSQPGGSDGCELEFIDQVKAPVSLKLPG
jgi:hypothetical protein